MPFKILVYSIMQHDEIYNSMYLLYSNIIYFFEHFFICKKQSISDFARDLRGHAKLDMNQLAKLFECWPNMEYDISHCRNVNYIPLSFIILCFVTLTSHENYFCLQILLPYNFLGHFTLFILNMDTRSVYIMDPMPCN